MRLRILTLKLPVRSARRENTSGILLRTGLPKFTRAASCMPVPELTLEAALSPIPAVAAPKRGRSELRNELVRFRYDHKTYK
jgi:hypothetical protein